MFPINTPNNDASGSPEASDPAAGTIACPHCGKLLQMQKIGGAAGGPNGGDYKNSNRKSNAAKMPMDQLKSVIQSERGE